MFSHGSRFTLSLELVRVPSQGYQRWAQHSPLLGVLGRRMGQCVRKASDDPTGIRRAVLSPLPHMRVTIHPLLILMSLVPDAAQLEPLSEAGWPTGEAGPARCPHPIHTPEQLNSCLLGYIRCSAGTKTEKIHPCSLHSEILCREMKLKTQAIQSSTGKFPW